MPTVDADAEAERAAFARYLRTGRRAAPLELKFNPYHDPETGRFTSADGVGNDDQGSGNLELASLRAFDKVAARMAFAANAGNLRTNIKRAFEKIGGRSFSDAEIESILTDVMNGRSTTRAGLELFRSPDVSHFSAAQIKVIDTYVGELPDSRLNRSVKAGWQSYLKSKKGLR